MTAAPAVAHQTVDSIKKAMTDVSDALLNDDEKLSEKLSSASTNLSNELAEISVGMVQGFVSPYSEQHGSS